MLEFAVLLVRVAVLGDLDGREVGDHRQAGGELAHVDVRIAARDDRPQLRIRARTLQADAVDVDEVADLTAVVQGAELAGDRIVRGDDRARSEDDGVLAAPVDGEVDVDVHALRGLHAQAG